MSCHRFSHPPEGIHMAALPETFARATAEGHRPRPWKPVTKGGLVLGKSRHIHMLQSSGVESAIRAALPVGACARSSWWCWGRRVCDLGDNRSEASLGGRPSEEVKWSHEEDPMDWLVATRPHLLGRFHSSSQPAAGSWRPHGLLGDRAHIRSWISIPGSPRTWLERTHTEGQVGDKRSILRPENLLVSRSYRRHESHAGISLSRTGSYHGLAFAWSTVCRRAVTDQALQPRSARYFLYHRKASVEAHCGLPCGKGIGLVHGVSH